MGTQQYYMFGGRALPPFLDPDKPFELIRGRSRIPDKEIQKINSYIPTVLKIIRKVRSMVWRMLCTLYYF